MNTNFIRSILYEFKKDYGDEVRYVTIDQSNLNVETGTRDFIKQAFTIRAIILPKKVERKFIQDIGYLAANKNFTYGALNDYNNIKLIIDGDDLPKNLDIDLNGYLVFNRKRYEKVSFEMVEHRLCFLLTCKGAEGGKPYDIVPLKLKSTLQLQHGVTIELN